ncbi:putative membrane protein [Candidatus Phytoplasma solani]|uniref:hypothetical protein n=1 Tax=Candidatus Phytoplasma solani TaxID=69896 RepID=UPI0032DB61F0
MFGRNFKYKFKSDKNFKLFFIVSFFSILVFCGTLWFFWCYFSDMKYQFIIFFVLLELFLAGLITIMYKNIKYLVNLENENYKRIPQMIKTIKKKTDEVSFDHEDYKIWDKLCQDLNKEYLTDAKTIIAEIIDIKNIFTVFENLKIKIKKELDKTLNNPKTEETYLKKFSNTKIYFELLEITNIKKWIEEFKHRKMDEGERTGLYKELNVCFQEAKLLQLDTVKKFIKENQETKNLNTLLDALYLKDKDHFFGLFFDNKEVQKEFLKKLTSFVNDMISKTNQNYLSNMKD